jgi:hypothetical protein
MRVSVPSWNRRVLVEPSRRHSASCALVRIFRPLKVANGEVGFDKVRAVEA